MCCGLIITQPSVGEFLLQGRNYYCSTYGKTQTQDPVSLKLWKSHILIINCFTIIVFSMSLKLWNSDVYMLISNGFFHRSHNWKKAERVLMFDVSH